MKETNRRRAWLLMAEGFSLVVEACRMLADVTTAEAIHLPPPPPPPPPPSPRPSTRDRLRSVTPTDTDRQRARSKLRSMGLLPEEES